MKTLIWVKEQNWKHEKKAAKEDEYIINYHNISDPSSCNFVVYAFLLLSLFSFSLLLSRSPSYAPSQLSALLLSLNVLKNSEWIKHLQFKDEAYFVGFFKHT